MTSPSAQKAAGEIFTKANIELPDASGYRYDTEIAASIIQQAITEAVDAAVAKERERCRKLVQEWRESAHIRAVITLGPAYAEFDKGVAHGELACAKNLESLVKNESEEK